MGPRAPQGPHPHPKKTPQGPPQGQGKGRGARDPRALGAVGRDGPMGPFGVIPKPFRMVSYSEASPNGKAVPNRWLFQKAMPCVHIAAKTPNRMSADLVGF